MPSLDGTGPSGRGPITGKGRGFCILTRTEEGSGQVKGFVGLQGVPVAQKAESVKNTGKEMINMPFGNGTGPAGMGPLTGRGAGYGAGFPVPGYANPAIRRRGSYGSGSRQLEPYGIGSYGRPQVPFYRAWFGRWLRGGFGLGRGFGRGRGWGRGRGRRGNW